MLLQPTIKLPPQFLFLEGDLMKKVKLGKTKRFFVLKDHLLSYYKSKSDYIKDPSKPRGSYNLENCELQPEGHGKEITHLKITTKITTTTPKSSTDQTLILCFNQKQTFITWSNAMIHNKDLYKKSGQTPKKLTSEITSGSERIEFVRPSDEPKSSSRSGRDKEAPPSQEHPQPQIHDTSIVMKIDEEFELNDDSTNFQNEEEEGGIEEKLQRRRVSSTYRQVRGGSFDRHDNPFPVRTLSVISEVNEYTYLSPKSTVKGSPEKIWRISPTKLIRSPPKIFSSPNGPGAFRNNIPALRERNQIFSTVYSASATNKPQHQQSMSESQPFPNNNPKIPVLCKDIFSCCTEKSTSTVFSPPQSKPVIMKPRKNAKSCERTPGTTGNRVISTKLAPHTPIEIDILDSPVIKLKDLATTTNSTRCSTNSLISDGNTTRKATVLKTRPQSEIELSSKPIPSDETLKIQFPKTVANQDLQFFHSTPNLAENYPDFSKKKDELLTTLSAIHHPEAIETLLQEKLSTSAPEELKKLISGIFEANYDLETMARAVRTLEECFEFYQELLETRAKSVILVAQKSKTHRLGNSFYRKCILYSNELLKLQATYCCYIQKLLLSDEISQLFLTKTTLTQRYFYFFEPNKNVPQETPMIHGRIIEKLVHKKFFNLRIVNANLWFLVDVHRKKPLV